MAHAKAVHRKMKMMAAIRLIMEVLPVLLTGRGGLGLNGSNIMLINCRSLSAHQAPAITWLPTKVVRDSQHQRRTGSSITRLTDSVSFTSGKEPRPKKTCQANESKIGWRNKAHPISSSAGELIVAIMRRIHKRETNRARNN